MTGGLQCDESAVCTLNEEAAVNVASTQGVDLRWVSSVETDSRCAKGETHLLAPPYIGRWQALLHLIPFVTFAMWL